MLTVISMYRRLVEVIKPQSARVDPVFRAKARLVRKSETDCRGPIWRVVLWPRASSQRSVLRDADVVGRREYEGLFGEDGGDSVEKVNGCVPHGMVAVDV